MDMFQADEDEATRLLDLAIARLKYNPDFAIEKIHEAQARISAIKERRTQELPAHIQKAAPPVERRMDELEARIVALEQPGHVIQFRKEG